MTQNRSLLGMSSPDQCQSKPSGTTPYRPSRSIIGTIIGVALVLGYLFYYRPYDATDGVLFWLAFTAWALPIAIFGWMYRRASKRRLNVALGRLMLAYAVLGIFLYVLSTGTRALDPVVLSGWPAWITGAIIGSNLASISRLWGR